MGLMDILNGMQHGPRGQRPPASSSSGGGGGMSPIMIRGIYAVQANVDRALAGAHQNAVPVLCRSFSCDDRALDALGAMRTNQ